MDVIEELKSFRENSPKKISRGGGGRGEGSGWGLRVDVNEELKFFVKIQKKKIWGVGVGGGSRGGVGGGGGVRVDVNEELKFL